MDGPTVFSLFGSRVLLDSNRVNRPNQPASRILAGKGMLAAAICTDLSAERVSHCCVNS